MRRHLKSPLHGSALFAYFAFAVQEPDSLMRIAWNRRESNMVWRLTMYYGKCQSSDSPFTCWIFVNRFVCGVLSGASMLSYVIMYRV